jgi:hypothetical protein
MSPSLDETELTAAPYLGNGLGCDEVYVSLRCDHGYSEAVWVAGDCEGAPLRTWDHETLAAWFCGLRGTVARMKAYRWFAWVLLRRRLRLGRSLRLVLETLPSLAGELFRAAHAAVVIERMETAGGRGSRALLFPHTRRRAPRRP